PRQVKLRTWLDRAVAVAAERTIDGEALIDDPLMQVQLAQALIGVEVLRHHAYRTVGEFLNGGAVGPDSSSVKLLMAEAEQRLAASAFEILGPDDEFWTETYLYSRAARVGGAAARRAPGVRALSRQRGAALRGPAPCRAGRDRAAGGEGRARG